MNITKDQYDAWMDNDVTKRFMDCIKEDLESVRCAKIYGNHESMIKIAHERNMSMEIFESILNWKPTEIQSDE